MNKIAIYGAGGFGREVLLMIKQVNAYRSQWNIIGFFDDQLPKGHFVDGITVLGGMQDLNMHKENLAVVLAIADPAVRKSIREKINNGRITFPLLVHPSANTGSEENQFGNGTIITAGVICTSGIKLGDFVIVNLAVTIGHDVKVGSCTTLMPASHISGNVNIGQGVLIGTGACVLQNLKIGNGSKIGAGAVVTRDIADSITVVGIPAKPQP